jgi:hypothetical protein
MDNTAVRFSLISCRREWLKQQVTDYWRQSATTENSYFLLACGSRKILPDCTASQPRKWHTGGRSVGIVRLWTEATEFFYMKPLINRMTVRKKWSDLPHASQLRNVSYVWKREQTYCYSQLKKDRCVKGIRRTKSVCREHPVLEYECSQPSTNALVKLAGSAFREAQECGMSTCGGVEEPAVSIFRVNSTLL